MANALTAGVHRATTWSLVVSVLMIVSGLLAIGITRFMLSLAVRRMLV